MTREPTRAEIAAAVREHLKIELLSWKPTRYCAHYRVLPSGGLDDLRYYTDGELIDACDGPPCLNLSGSVKNLGEVAYVTVRI